MSHVFISYSRQDSEYVERLVAKLRAERFTVWYDKETNYGASWWAMIVDAIRESGALILVMTPISGASYWVQQELLYAIDQRKQIFPLLLKGSLDSAHAWRSIGSVQYLDVRDKLLPDARFFDELAKHVGRQKNKGRLITPSLSAPQPPAPDVTSVLPAPFEWCFIPAGKVAVTYDKQEDVAADIPPFHMAKYPVTNAQYDAFVSARDGYADPHWWDYSEEARAWRARNARPGRSTFGGDDCPRTDVTLYEAIAFCAWLESRTSKAWGAQAAQLRITLPDERQWQRAAQGDNRCMFPWGDAFDPSRCNTRRSGAGRTTPVTQYPAGASPFGVMDMAGNVWEWCFLANGAAASEGGSEGKTILRGGSWNHNAEKYFRCDFRSGYIPNMTHSVRGFRIAYAH